jgi:hypothetical protein
MRFSPTEADAQSMKVIELLINSGHYKAYRKEEVIKIIGKDANLLAYALTEPGKGDEPKVQFERSKPERSSSSS